MNRYVLSASKSWLLLCVHQQVTVDRSRLVDSGIDYFRRMRQSEWATPLRIAFAQEAGIDAGGLRCEFFTQFFRGLCNLSDGDSSPFERDVDSQYYHAKQLLPRGARREKAETLLRITARALAALLADDRASLPTPLFAPLVFLSFSR